MELLRVAVGRSYRELAGMLGRSEGALRVQMHRCVQRVRDLLAERDARTEAPKSQGGR